jgi:hypothetical protein
MAKEGLTLYLYSRVNKRLNVYEHLQQDTTELKGEGNRLATNKNDSIQNMNVQTDKAYSAESRATSRVHFLGKFPIILCLSSVSAQR